MSWISGHGAKIVTLSQASTHPDMTLDVAWTETNQRTNEPTNQRTKGHIPHLLIQIPAATCE